MPGTIWGTKLGEKGVFGQIFSASVDNETKTVNLLAVEQDEVHRYLFELVAAQ